MFKVPTDMRYFAYRRYFVSRDRRWAAKWSVSQLGGFLKGSGKVYGPTKDDVVMQAKAAQEKWLNSEERNV